MSDAMLLGILRMESLEIVQLVSAARRAADRIKADAKEIERLRHRCACLTGSLVNMVVTFENDNTQQERASALQSAKIILMDSDTRGRNE
jgi:hypothetical protein